MRLVFGMMTKFDHFYMIVAFEAAKLSHAIRAQVGAVIVRDRNILAYGYNGTPAGMDNTCEERIYDRLPEYGSLKDYIYDRENDRHYRFKTKPEVIHAEENAILKVAQSTDSTNGSTLYCTHAPCIRCARMIFSVGIKRVFYSENYKTDDGLVFLTNQKIEVTQYEP